MIAVSFSSVSDLTLTIWTVKKFKIFASTKLKKKKTLLASENIGHLIPFKSKWSLYIYFWKKPHAKCLN